MFRIKTFFLSDPVFSDVSLANVVQFCQHKHASECLWARAPIQQRTLLPIVSSFWKEFALIVVLPLQTAGLNVCVRVCVRLSVCLYSVIGMVMHSHSMSEQTLRPRFAY